MSGKGESSDGLSFCREWLGRWCVSYKKDNEYERNRRMVVSKNVDMLIFNYYWEVQMAITSKQLNASQELRRDI